MSVRLDVDWQKYQQWADSKAPLVRGGVVGAIGLGRSKQ